MSDYFDPNNEELLRDFFVEAESQLTLIEETILVLESDFTDRTTLDTLFRAAHTLKGGAATVQMGEIESFTHKMEDLLDKLRDASIKVNEEIIDTLLQAFDILKEMLTQRKKGSIFTQNTAEIEQRLEHQNNNQAHVTKKDTQSEHGEKQLEQLISSLKEQCQEKEQLYHLYAELNPAQPMQSIAQVQLYAKIKELSSALYSIPDIDTLSQDTFYEQVDYYFCSSHSQQDIEQHCHIEEVTLLLKVQTVNTAAANETIKEKETEEQSATQALLKTEAERKNRTKPAPQKAMQQISSPSSILRVDSQRIDTLLNLVSEAVINKASFNQIALQFVELQENLQLLHTFIRQRVGSYNEQVIAQIESHVSNRSTELRELRSTLKKQLRIFHQALDPLESQVKKMSNQFNQSSLKLTRNTSEMHESILSMRMIPISLIFNRFPRLVRDLSHSLGKKISLQLEGQNTEIDKSVIEELADPLMHCVRNSIDHGIEDIETRKQKGKVENGTIFIRASHEGNMVLIEIADDGQGINLELIYEKAQQKGLIPPHKTLDPQEAYNLIFAPGFSTAEKITNISGRGVGLDVVKQQIEKLNGSINIWSEPNKGSRFTIKLPLTLAIIQALQVQVGEQIYAIPIAAVSESIRIRAEELVYVDKHEMVKIDKEVISLLRLSTLLQNKHLTTADTFYIVVVGSAERRIGLVVDNLIGEEDVVIKPLKDRYTNTPGIAGATILGDGRVSLILDVSRLLDLGIEYQRLLRNKNLPVSKSH